MWENTQPQKRNPCKQDAPRKFPKLQELTKAIGQSEKGKQSADRNISSKTFCKTQQCFRTSTFCTHQTKPTRNYTFCNSECKHATPNKSVGAKDQQTQREARGQVLASLRALKSLLNIIAFNHSTSLLHSQPTSKARTESGSK